MQAVALDLFSKRGYSGVSVRDICGELGLKESALYYHFKNKEELLNSLYAKVDQLVEDMRNASDDNAGIYPGYANGSQKFSAAIFL